MSLSDFAKDLQATVPPEPSAYTDPAVVALGVRARATQRSTTGFRVLVAHLVLGRAEAAAQRAARFHELCRSRLDDDHVRQQLVEVKEWSSHEPRAGFFAVWLPQTLLRGLVVVNLIEPMLVYETLREALDVPRSAPLLSLDQRLTFVAAGVAVIAALIILSSAFVGGRALGWIAFHQPVVQAKGDYPEAGRTRQALPMSRALVLGCLSIVLLSAMTVFMHSLAQARIRGGVNAFLGQENHALTGAVVWLLTLAPAMLLAVKVLASHPVQLHHQKVEKLKRKHARQQRRDIRHEAALLQRQRTARMRSSVLMDLVDSKLQGTALAVAAEYATAAMATGAPQTNRLAGQVRSAGLVPHEEGQPEGVAGEENFLWRTQYGSPVIQGLRARFAALPEAPSETPIASVWAGLMENPTGFSFEPVSPTEEQPSSPLHVVGE